MVVAGGGEVAGGDGELAVGADVAGGDGLGALGHVAVGVGGVERHPELAGLDLAALEGLGAGEGRGGLLGLVLRVLHRDI